MDKFGIFELLDTLSEITSSAEETNVNEEAPASRPSPDDKSFQPPDLGGAIADEQKVKRDAISSLYERHESISKRIDKKQ